MRRSVLTIFLLINCLFLNAEEFYAFRDTITMQSGEMQISLERPVTSCIIETVNPEDLKNSVQFLYQNKWYVPIPDHDPESYRKSEPIIFENKITHIALRSDRNMKLILHCVFAPPLLPVAVSNQSLAAFCLKPIAVSPDIWRSGLPDPKPGRVATTVKHCIVHHSAGSNFNHDYVNVIRNIYLLHTQSNGWDDIGYNYLIAQNGDLYVGRDPQGVADEDNIAGAHFCGKNTGTMGVCLLGTYTDTIPSDTTFGTLKHLLSWKLFKENLEPKGQFIHPTGGTEFLPVLAGHRDGCSTECPGEQVYNKLNKIRNDVESMLDTCKQFSGLSENRENCGNFELNRDEIQFNIPTNSVTIVKIYNSMGSCVFSTLINGDERVSIHSLSPGIYFLQFQTGGCFKHQKIAISSFTQ